MAEIKIEKKKPIWPWILVALVIAGLIVYFLAFNDDNQRNMERTNIPAYTSTPEQPDLSRQNENNSRVITYVDFIEDSDANMGLDHEYTNEALKKLTEATEAMANEVNYEVEADIEQVNEYAQMIATDPFETTHADNIKNASEIINRVLQNIQQEKYPDLSGDVDALQNASAAIKAGVLTLDQKDTVKNYFEQAAELLKKMN